MDGRVGLLSRNTSSKEKGGRDDGEGQHDDDEQGTEGLGEREGVRQVLRGKKHDERNRLLPFVSPLQFNPTSSLFIRSTGQPVIEFRNCPSGSVLSSVTWYCGVADVGLVGIVVIVSLTYVATLFGTVEAST